MDEMISKAVRELEENNARYWVAIRMDRRLRRLNPSMIAGSDCLDRKAMAGVVCLEPHYFSKYFRSITGISFREFVRESRVLLAIKLLRESLSIDIVVGRVGFRTRRCLERAFAGVIHRTPKYFRGDVR